MTTFDDPIFRQLTAVAGEAFFIYELSKKALIEVGPAIKNFFVFPPRAMESPESLIDLVHPDDRDYLHQLINRFSAKRSLKAEFRLLEENGEGRYVQLNAYQINDQSLVAGWLTDIDNEKQNILYAEKINARKNAMLELLAHDLKEPVGIINMMAGALAKSEAVLADRASQEYIRVISELCETNIRLIRELVEEELMGASGVALRIERADLAAAVRDIMKTYAASAPVIKKQFVFETSAPQIYLLMDTLKIIQIVNNLVSNAIKFTADGGRITVRLAEKESVVRISVSDDGIGIPETLQPFLFEPHSKAQRPGVRGEAGTGMGLSIIKGLITLHNGRLWLDTEQEIGATFHIELPKF